MKRLLLLITLLSIGCTMTALHKHQLLMFVHAHPSSFTDEEGLNVAYQMLTACIQRAAPILVSENIWQHVVLRRERFAQALKDPASIQSSFISMYRVTNQTIKQQANVGQVNQLLHHDWYAKNYPQLAKLDADVVKHLQFDFFCYYVFDYLKNFTFYRLLEGYVLCIPEGMSDGFCLDHAYKLSSKTIQKPVFTKKSLSLHAVLQKYLCPYKQHAWCFYLTGHGYHKDTDHSESMIAGMTITLFNKLLQVLNNKTFTTQLLAYSSCYAAGEHAIISYQEGESGFKQSLVLAYPVLMLTLTDAPTYVFGVPSGFKLPPYSYRSRLKPDEASEQGLQFYFLQNFNKFCDCAQSSKCTIAMARALNPYIRCISSACDVTKVENLPLIRHAYQRCFIPLDKSAVSCLVPQNYSSSKITVKNKAALLWYVKQYPGTIVLTSKIPAFVSMIPAGQVHHAHTLQATGIGFQRLVREAFLSIDDMHDQQIFLFDRVLCSFVIDAISKQSSHEITNVIVMTAGAWLPDFAQKDASCYVYLEHCGQGYWLHFDQDKQLVDCFPISDEQQDLMYRFKALLMQECLFGYKLSVEQLLSPHYLQQRKILQQKLLATCLQEKVCK